MLTSHRRSLFLGAQNANGIGFISHNRLTMIATNPANNATVTGVTTSADSSTMASDELSSSSSVPSFQAPQSDDDNASKLKPNNGIAQPADDEDSEANVEAAISNMHPLSLSDPPAGKAEQNKDNARADAAVLVCSPDFD